MPEHLSDIATEKSVLAHIIGMPDSLDDVRSRLDVDSFDDGDCKTIWQAIVWSRDKGKVPDALYLKSLFRSHGRDSDVDAVDRIISAQVSSNLIQQVETLEEYRKRRVMHNLRVKLMQHEDDDSETLSSLVMKALDEKDKFTASNVLDKVGLMQHAADVIYGNLDPNKENFQIYTGFRIIDDAGGLPPESEIILAAFSSQGKTSLAMNILDMAMRNGIRCAIYSAEMGKGSISGRFLNMMGWGVPITMFKTQPLLQNTVDDFQRLAQSFIARPGDVFLDDTSTNNVDYICSSIRVLYRKQNVRLVMVDYLQIIALYEEGNDDQAKLARASRKLQAVAKELGITIIVLSQFSRPTRDSGHLPSEDLIRGSGQIYEACDIALYIYRPEKWEKESYPYPFDDARKEGTAMLMIGKYRDGNSNQKEIVGFDGTSTSFYEFPAGCYDDDPKKNYPKESPLPLKDDEEQKPF